MQDSEEVPGKKLAVAVFSYNRGDYLHNCVKSIRQMMPFADVTVYDDASDDPHTLAVLDVLKAKVVRATAAFKAQHGGLYRNMQRAFLEAEAEWLLFIQDDMEIVRQVDEDDLAVIAAIFASDPDIGLVYPGFMKAAISDRLHTQFVPEERLRCYVPDASTPRDRMRYAFSDVTLVHVGRARAAGFTIREGEGANEEMARQLFSVMPFMADPFLFYCPQVPTFRNRRRTLSSRLAGMHLKAADSSGTGVASVFDTGFFPMTAAEVARLRSRSLMQWPFAEDFLTTTLSDVRRPFVFQDFEARKDLAVLAKVEYLWLSLRRRLRRLAGRLLVKDRG